MRTPSPPLLSTPPVVSARLSGCLHDGRRPLAGRHDCLSHTQITRTKARRLRPACLPADSLCTTVHSSPPAYCSLPGRGRGRHARRRANTRAHTHRRRTVATQPLPPPPYPILGPLAQPDPSGVQAAASNRAGPSDHAPSAGPVSRHPPGPPVLGDWGSLDWPSCRSRGRTHATRARAGVVRAPVAGTSTRARPAPARR